jgi:hypothetical protein
MPLDRLTSRFEKSVTQANNTARVQLDMILANEKALLSVRGGDKKLQAAKDFRARLLEGESFTEAQYSYIDAIYEAMWRGAGMESINTHVDRKRKSLRYG